MADLDDQFYDQLSQRLNRQDDQLDRIEKGQDALLECVSNQKTTLFSHLESDRSNFAWISWILGGTWAGLLAIVGYLLRH